MDIKNRSIKILDNEVASQIAAGEVIERPVSVVKELIENAIDANATQISVFIEDAGKKLIEISDNGYGIAFEELDLAVTRHATSKLQTAEELFNITTLGFRGEALASIASISQFELISRAKDEEIGGKILVDSGRITGKNKVGTPVGTSITVRNLFYSVPARLKFLKTNSTENRRISALIVRFAMAYPDIKFMLEIDQRKVLQTTGNGDRLEILAHLYGLEIAKKMLEVRLVESNYQVSGYISPIAITRSNRKEITFFVNGRWVNDISLSSALLRAYHTMIMVGRYPIATLFLTIPPNDLDVNVHPTKAEIRFKDPNYCFSLVQRATRRALITYSSSPDFPAKMWQMNTNFQNGPIGQGVVEWSSGINPGDSNFINYEPDPPEGNSISTKGDSIINLTKSNFPLLRLIGQVGATYLVSEGPDGLYLIDQHAAHERILFEKLMSQLSEKILSQDLLIPEVIQFPPHQYLMVHEKLPVLNRLGFSVVEFGPNSFQIRSIPALLIGLDPSAALRVIVEEFESDETPLANEIEALIAARVCKRAAVKAGQILTREEQLALIEGLEACNSPRTCPHGRPTMIHLSVNLLEKQFGRKGSI
jgi:DNA mismatch repair protein MutL